MVISRIGTSGSSAAHSAVVLCSWTLPSHFLKFSAGLESIKNKYEEPFPDFNEKTCAAVGLFLISVIWRSGPSELLCAVLWPYQAVPRRERPLSNVFWQFWAFFREEWGKIYYFFENEKSVKFKMPKMWDFRNVEHLGAPPKLYREVWRGCVYSGTFWCDFVAVVTENPTSTP